jgi:Zn-dependent protease with chaperone function
MTNAEFDSLVARLERLARNDPRSYRTRVLILALLGYGYLALVLVASTLVLAAMVAAVAASKGSAIFLKFALIPLAFIFIILRALWVRFDAPEGIALSRRNHKPLFEVIAELRAQLHGPRIHQVLLTDEFNAAIVQKPRLGIFGWPKNYLILGLPAMRALSPEQFKAVLAHEYCHLAGAHGKFGAWIYRIRQTWTQLLGKLEAQQHWGSFVFSPFLKWYAPFLNAYSFVLARENEYLADRCAADVVGAETAADALVSVATKGLFISRRLWPRIYEQANDQPVPSHGLHFFMPQALSEEYPQNAGEFLTQAMRVKTSNLDTHPALADRVAALGQQPRIPPRVGTDAATQYLGETLPGYVQRFEEKWKGGVTASWKQRYEEVQQQKRTLAVIGAKAKAGAITQDEMWQRAQITNRLQGLEAAYPLYEALALHNPDHAGAQYMIGVYLLTRKQDEGLDRIKRSIALDDQLSMPGYREMYDYLSANDREAEAQDIYARAVEREALEEKARAERSSVSTQDRLVPHGLSMAQVGEIRDQLRQHWQVEDAYLVRKELTYLAQQPMWFLGLSRQPGDSELSDAAFLEQLLASTPFPAGILVAILTPDHAALRKAIRKVPDALIYNRRKHRCDPN